MKKKIFRWDLLFEALFIVGWLIMLICDFYKMSIEPFFTHVECGYSWYGVTLFITTSALSMLFWEDLEDKIKSVSTMRPVEHTNK